MLAVALSYLVWTWPREATEIDCDSLGATMMPHDFDRDLTHSSSLASTGSHLEGLTTAFATPPFNLILGTSMRLVPECHRALQYSRCWSFLHSWMARSSSRPKRCLAGHSLSARKMCGCSLFPTFSARQILAHRTPYGRSSSRIS